MKCKFWTNNYIEDVLSVYTIWAVPTHEFWKYETSTIRYGCLGGTTSKQLRKIVSFWKHGSIYECKSPAYFALEFSHKNCFSSVLSRDVNSVKPSLPSHTQNTSTLDHRYSLSRDPLQYSIIWWANPERESHIVFTHGTAENVKWLFRPSNTDTNKIK